MIKIENLHKSFGGNHVLKGIDLDLDQKGITAILGPNGSGKTTLIKTILGMVIPDSGYIEYDGKDVKNQFKYRNEISHMPQIAHFPENLNSKEIISMMKNLRSGETNDEYFIKLFGLESELPKKMRNLSGGTKQKVNFTITMMYDTPIIILDEPTTGLDPLALQNVKMHLRKLKEQGKQILITTHIMSFVEEVADNIIFLLEGKIYFKGKLSELLEKQKETKLETAIANILKTHAG